MVASFGPCTAIAVGSARGAHTRLGDGAGSRMLSPSVAACRHPRGWWQSVGASAPPPSRSSTGPSTAIPPKTPQPEELRRLRTGLAGRCGWKRCDCNNRRQGVYIASFPEPAETRDLDEAQYRAKTPNRWDAQYPSPSSRYAVQGRPTRTVDTLAQPVASRRAGSCHGGVGSADLRDK